MKIPRERLLSFGEKRGRDAGGDSGRDDRKRARSTQPNFSRSRGIRIPVAPSARPEAGGPSSSRGPPARAHEAEGRVTPKTETVRATSPATTRATSSAVIVIDEASPEGASQVPARASAEAAGAAASSTGGEPRGTAAEVSAPRDDGGSRRAVVVAPAPNRGQGASAGASAPLGGSEASRGGRAEAVDIPVDVPESSVPRATNAARGLPGGERSSALASALAERIIDSFAASIEWTGGSIPEAEDILRAFLSPVLQVSLGFGDLWRTCQSFDFSRGAAREARAEVERLKQELESASERERVLRQEIDTSAEAQRKREVLLAKARADAESNAALLRAAEEKCSEVSKELQATSGELERSRSRLRKEERSVEEAKKAASLARKEASDARKSAARAKDEAARAREETADARGEATRAGEEVAEAKGEATRLAEELAVARGEAACAREEAAAARAEAGKAVEAFRASKEFSEEFVEAAYDAFCEGFAECKERVARAYDLPDLEKISLPAPEKQGAEEELEATSGEGAIPALGSVPEAEAAPGPVPGDAPEVEAAPESTAVAVSVIEVGDEGEGKDTGRSSPGPSEPEPLRAVVARVHSEVHAIVDAAVEELGRASNP